MMALSIPRYMQAAHIQDETILYKWDDWNSEGAEQQIDEESQKRLEKVSQRASLAFSIGTAEWIVHRFGMLCDDPLPWQYLESAWAQVVHPLYGNLTIEGDVDPNAWAGPVRRPIWRAMVHVGLALTETEGDGTPSLPATWITSLSHYVMTDPVPYQMWREGIMKRMETLYPFDSEEHLGEVIPREALDPGLDFRLEQTESMINEFLAGLTYRVNPFLSSPAQMLQQGFEGTPYTFSIRKDRQDRFEW